MSNKVLSVIFLIIIAALVVGWATIFTGCMYEPAMSTPCNYPNRVCVWTVESRCRPGEQLRNCYWESVRRENCYCQEHTVQRYPWQVR
jgi:hypothetical protein